MGHRIQKIKAGLQTEYPISGLSVSVKLAGQFHSFLHNGRQIKISIPVKYYNSNAIKRDSEAAEYATAVSWMKTTRFKKDYYRTTHLHIKRIFIYVEINSNDNIIINKDITDEEDINEKRNILYKLNGEERIHKLGVNLSSYAENAFQYWCRIARWKTKAWEIGMPVINNLYSNAYSYFVTDDPPGYLCINNQRISVRLGADSIDMTEWRQIEHALKSQNEPPVWFNVLCEAKNNHSDGNYREAIINAAISAETILRRRAFEAVSSLKTTDPAIVRLVDDWSIRSLLGKLGDISTTKKHKLTKKQISGLHKLFDLRNDIMHKGKMLMNQSTSKRAIDTVEAMHERL